ncbi:uncharacterized protein LOC134528282 isoform X2 [Bacillus rossius redtenbacheri]|uniref:uncharacterized protein LOC134528282 isoform X2 n=1 Tax=Bacillus rossius redtenbacheri TaxID=93214 RepID=UPI002FDDAA43
MMLTAWSTEQAKRSASLPSLVTDYDSKAEDMSEAELIAAIQRTQSKLTFLQQENCMLESLLARTNRRLLEGLQRHLDQKGKAALLAGKRLMAVAASSLLGSSGQLSHRSSDSLSSPLASGPRSGSVRGAAPIDENVFRLNIHQKCALASRELEEVLAATLRRKSQFARQRSRLSAESESAGLVLREVTGILDCLRECLAGPNIPSSKLIRALEVSLKGVERKMQMLQLHSNALRQRLRRRCAGEGPERLVEAVDLEKEEIDNQVCLGRIKEQRVQFYELHRLDDHYMAEDHRGRSALSRQLERLELLEGQLRDKRAARDKLAQQQALAEAELARAEQGHAAMRTVCETYQGVDPMDYLKKKAEIEDLRRQLKTWHRKNEVQRGTLKMNSQTFQRLMQAAKSQGAAH